MKVLVTGATGFVGAETVRTLHRQGHFVLATGRDKAKARQKLSSEIHFQIQDLNSRLDFEDCQAVIHVAGLSSPWNSRDQFLRSNVQATQNLLRWSKAAGVEHFLYISTSGVYFANDSKRDVPETTPLPNRELQHPYVSSKRLAEEAVTDSGLNFSILRPRAIYGPQDPSLLPRIIDRLRRRRLPILGAGQNVTSLTHVDNLAEAIGHILSKGPSGVLNICDGKAVRIWDTIAKIADHIGAKRPQRRVPRGLAHRLAGLAELAHLRFPQLGEPSLTRYTVGLLTLSQTLCIDKARSLGYEPIWDTQTGIERTLQEWVA